jgi:hypothetical protein
MPAPTTQHLATRDWPLYWFATLDQAVHQGDYEAAAEAQRELAKLGVRVRYGRAPIAAAAQKAAVRT